MYWSEGSFVFASPQVTTPGAQRIICIQTGETPTAHRHSRSQFNRPTQRKNLFFISWKIPSLCTSSAIKPLKVQPKGVVSFTLPASFLIAPHLFSGNTKGKGQRAKSAWGESSFFLLLRYQILLLIKFHVSTGQNGLINLAPFKEASAIISMDLFWVYFNPFRQSVRGRPGTGRVVFWYEMTGFGKVGSGAFLGI